MHLAALDTNKDEPLRNDIRLLGRILGDTVREQEGDAIFRHCRARPPDRRALCPRRRPRGQDHAPNSPPCSTHCRATRRRPSSAPSATSCNWPTSPRTSTISAGAAPTIWPARRRAKAAWCMRLINWPKARSPEAIADFFANAVVAPVLTAHPTEVQRQSLIRNHRDIARLLDQRERLQMTPDEEAENDLAWPMPS
jgi:phosphoenolpyruvate carboxylase